MARSREGAEWYHRAGGRGRGRGDYRGRGRGATNHNRVHDDVEDVETNTANPKIAREDLDMSFEREEVKAGDIPYNSAIQGSNKQNRSPFYGLPSVILDIVESEEIFREDLKNKCGLEEPIRLVKLSRGGIRIFNKDLSRLSPDILIKVWPGWSLGIHSWELSSDSCNNFVWIFEN